MSIRPGSYRQIAKMTEVTAFKLEAQRAAVFTTDAGTAIRKACRFSTPT